MKIRLFHAFASNNSGSYTIVGSFGDAATAERVASVLKEACDAHHVWYEAHNYQEDGESPLDALAKREGLPGDKPGRTDDWPAHGPSPSIVATDRQVLVHVPCTVTMPPIFGALFYAKGGRVETEVNHAHEDLAVSFHYWAASLRYDDPKRDELLDAFERRVREELPAWTRRAELSDKKPVEPVWRPDDWGTRELVAVFDDLVEGVAGVRGIARDFELRLALRIWECPHGVPDPFGLLRGRPVRAGRYRVILWRVGSDRIAAMKAVRDAIGAGLTAAKTTLDELPLEILVDVAEDEARRAADLLVGAGCEAEVVLPAAR
jgi:hypothetical protein